MILDETPLNLQTNKKGILNGRTTQMDLEAGAWPVDVWYDRWEGPAQANYGASVGKSGLQPATRSKIAVG